MCQLQPKYAKQIKAGSYEENHIFARQGIVFKVQTDNLDYQFVKDKFLISQYITVLQGFAKINDAIKIILKRDNEMQICAQQKFRIKSLQNLLE